MRRSTQQIHVPSVDRRLKQPNLPLNIGERQSGMEASNEIEPHIDDESDDETPPEVLLAQERARLAQLREQRDELERKVATCLLYTSPSPRD